MTDTPNRSTTATTARRPDCVTEVRRGNTVLVVSGYFKQDTTATATDKMMKVLEAETAAAPKPHLLPHKPGMKKRSCRGV